jgi:uncharacterized membrane protein (UPF0127 family)
MSRIAAILLMLLTSCCAPEAEPVPDPGTPRRTLYLLPVRAGTGLPAGTMAHAVARVEVAADSFSRQRGLMERGHLRPDHGMIFIYPEEDRLGFWMKNTRIPLSIAYADPTGRIVTILDMEPGIGIADDDLPRYPSGRPALYALEMDQGWFEERGIRVGDRIVLHPEIAATEVR